MFTFRPMQVQDRIAVANMIKTLYKTLNAPDDYMTDKKIAATFEQIDLCTGYVHIDVFEWDKTIVGYALLFKFWYNEFGGMILNVDELFTMPDFRNRGIVSHYLNELSEKKNEYMALSLEVLPQNKGAYSLYKRAGFTEKETISLYKLLE